MWQDAINIAILGLVALADIILAYLALTEHKRKKAMMEIVGSQCLYVDRSEGTKDALYATGRLRVANAGWRPSAFRAWISCPDASTPEERSLLEAAIFRGGPDVEPPQELNDGEFTEPNLAPGELAEFFWQILLPTSLDRDKTRWRIHVKPIMEGDGDEDILSQPHLIHMEPPVVRDPTLAGGR